MDPIVWVALIGLPTQLIIAVATLRKATSADNAVNHRVQGGPTISDDIQDIKAEVRAQRKDIVWLIRTFSEHLRSHTRDRTM